MKKIELLMVIIAQTFLVMSCGPVSITPEEKVENLTHLFYKYVMKNDVDSIKILYPTIDLDLMNIKCDSFSIKDIKSTSDDGYEVHLVQNYSENNSEELNQKINVSLYFTKVDSLKTEYIIKDSKGYFDNPEKKYYMSLCGSIILDKKYTDMDYLERLRITNIIYENKAQEIADYLNQNIEIIFSMTNLLGDYYALVDNEMGEVSFTLNNRTDYSCQGFTVYLTLNNVYDGTYQGEISGYYDYADARLKAHSSHRYRINFNKNELKNPNSGFKSCVQKAVFKTTPEALLKYSAAEFQFNGNEYEEFVKSEKK